MCEHVNLPFQAGDDRVLKDMRRGYASDDYRRLVDRIRNAIPGVSMSTDVIVGFPGETDDEFESTLDLIRDLRFDKVHVAAYSDREGTIAHRRMDDDVPHDVKRARVQAIEQLQESIVESINAELMGRVEPVLVEGSSREGWQGRTRSNKLVYFSHDEDLTGRWLTSESREPAPGR